MTVFHYFVHCNFILVGASCMTKDKYYMRQESRHDSVVNKNIIHKHKQT